MDSNSDSTISRDNLLNMSASDILGIDPSDKKETKQEAPKQEAPKQEAPKTINRDNLLNMSASDIMGVSDDELKTPITQTNKEETPEEPTTARNFVEKKVKEGGEALFGKEPESRQVSPEVQSVLNLVENKKGWELSGEGFRNKHLAPLSPEQLEEFHQAKPEVDLGNLYDKIYDLDKQRGQNSPNWGGVALKIATGDLPGAAIEGYNQYNKNPEEAKRQLISAPKSLYDLAGGLASGTSKVAVDAAQLSPTEVLRKLSTGDIQGIKESGKQIAKDVGSFTNWIPESGQELYYTGKKLIDGGNRYLDELAEQLGQSEETSKAHARARHAVDALHEQAKKEAGSTGWSQAATGALSKGITSHIIQLTTDKTKEEADKQADEITQSVAQSFKPEEDIALTGSMVSPVPMGAEVALLERIPGAIKGAKAFAKEAREGGKLYEAVNAEDTLAGKIKAAATTPIEIPKVAPKEGPGIGYKAAGVIASPLAKGAEAVKKASEKYPLTSAAIGAGVGYLAKGFLGAPAGAFLYRWVPKLAAAVPESVLKISEAGGFEAAGKAAAERLKTPEYSAAKASSAAKSEDIATIIKNVLGKNKNPYAVDEFLSKAFAGNGGKTIDTLNRYIGKYGYTGAKLGALSAATGVINSNTPDEIADAATTGAIVGILQMGAHDSARGLGRLIKLGPKSVQAETIKENEQNINEIGKQSKASQDNYKAASSWKRALESKQGAYKDAVNEGNEKDAKRLANDILKMQKASPATIAAYQHEFNASIGNLQRAAQSLGATHIELLTEDQMGSAPSGSLPINLTEATSEAVRTGKTLFQAINDQATRHLGELSRQRAESPVVEQAVKDSTAEIKSGKSKSRKKVLDPNAPLSKGASAAVNATRDPVVVSAAESALKQLGFSDKEAKAKIAGVATFTDPSDLVAKALGRNEPKTEQSQPVQPKTEQPKPVQLEMSLEDARREKASKAKKSIADEIKRRGNEAGFLNLEPVIDLGRHLVRMGKTFKEWASSMIEDLGEAIKPHLQSIWNRVHDIVSDETGAVGSKKSKIEEKAEQVKPTEEATPTEKANQERIGSAAYKDPKTGEVFQAPSHEGALAKAKAAGAELPQGDTTKPENRETPEFGFTTTDGKFVSREEAEKIAKESGQLTGEKARDLLHSHEVDQDSYPETGFSTEDAVKSIDSLGDKQSPQTDAKTRPYPKNTNPNSVVLPPRWGFVNKAIVGMPKSVKEVTDIVDRAVSRIKAAQSKDPEGTKKQATFYSDMANSADKLADIASPGVKGLDKAKLAELNLRFLAMGSPRSTVGANATKSLFSIASAATGSAPGGFKLGFGDLTKGAKQTHQDWVNGKHFNMDLKGVDNKVRNFYSNGLAELIDTYKAAGDEASVKYLETQLAKSLGIIEPSAESIPDDVRETFEHKVKGSATVDMWDMAAKGYAVPGMVFDVKSPVGKQDKFTWSQDKFAKNYQTGGNVWKRVAKALSSKNNIVKSPEDLDFYQARALRIDGNRDWNADTWEKRKQQGFDKPVSFTMFSQGSEAGLSPGGAGPVYDAQQAIDGLIADKLNAEGLAKAFGKDKLTAYNAQEILWAIEKADSPVKSNRDLSLYGKSFEDLFNRIESLRKGQDASKKDPGQASLDNTLEAYKRLSGQTLPFEIVSQGTGIGKDIRNTLEELRSGGDTTPEKTLTAKFSNGLGEKINKFATENGIDLIVVSSKNAEGGYTESGATSVSPNTVLLLRGDIGHISALKDALSYELDQDAGNVIRKPTLQELNDPNVKKNTILSIKTGDMSQAQIKSLFDDLSKLKDSDGNQFLTGFTPSSDGIIIGDQYYGGDIEAAILNNPNFKNVLKTHNVEDYDVGDAIIDTYNRSKGEKVSNDWSDLVNNHLQSVLSPKSAEVVSPVIEASRKDNEMSPIASTLKDRINKVDISTMNKTKSKEMLEGLNQMISAHVLVDDISEAEGEILKSEIQKISSKESVKDVEQKQ